VPKIAAESLDANRSLRENDLMQAALDLARDEGWSEVTLAAVSRKAGLSRTAVYSYFDSAADLIADVLLDELMEITQVLAATLDAPGSPLDRINAWLTAAVAYVADGRHALVRSAAEVPLPPVRRAEVTSWHRRVAEPLVGLLEFTGAEDPRATAAYIWALVEVAVRRMDAGASGASELAALRCAVAKLCASA